MQLEQTIQNLPTNPGCYLFRNSLNTVIYVGKAKNVKKRVASYFRDSVREQKNKTALLVSKVAHIECMTTTSEVEAFILENNLIKRYAPRFNIQLRDDKTYPYVQVNLAEDFPRPVYTRKPRYGKGQVVFGPFVVGSRIREVLQVLVKSLKLRDCSLHDFRTRTEPCLYYQMDLCTAPCVGKISKENYRASIQMMMDFLSGKVRNLLSSMKQEMLSEADCERFERAKMLRDSLELLKEFSSEHLNRKFKAQGRIQDVDVLSARASYKEDMSGKRVLKGGDVGIYKVRNGVIMGATHFYFRHKGEWNSFDQALTTSLYQYYAKNTFSLPQLLLLEKPLKENMAELLGAGLSELLKSKKIKGNLKLEIFDEQKSKAAYADLVRLSKEYVLQKAKARKEGLKDEDKALLELQRLLRRDLSVELVECYDVAVFQGSSPTGAKVVSMNGVLEKKLYRYYHLTELPQGNDDFSMMKELVSRRLKDPGLPDILIIDGGKGQMAPFERMLKERGARDVDVLGLKKARAGVSGSKGEERLVSVRLNREWVLKEGSPLYKLVTGLRDEAHRFCRKLHHKEEIKRVLGKSKKIKSNK